MVNYHLSADAKRVGHLFYEFIKSNGIRNIGSTNESLLAVINTYAGINDYVLSSFILKNDKIEGEFYHSASIAIVLDSISPVHYVLKLIYYVVNNGGRPTLILDVPSYDPLDLVILRSLESYFNKIVIIQDDSRLKKKIS